MTLGQRIRSGVAWVMFGETGSHVLQFLFGIALARLLVPADFGMIATIQILTGIAGIVSSGGMGQSLIRAREASKEDFDVVFTLQFGVCLLICAAIFAIAPWFARFFENPLYVPLLGISALSFLLRPFAVVRSAWLTREMRFKGAATANLGTSVVIGFASVGMAFGGMGVWSLSLSGLLAALTINLLLYRLCPLRLNLRLDASTMRRHVTFGFNLTVLDLISHFRMQIFNLILSKLAGPAALGLFNKGESLARMPNRLITPATGKVVFRALSSVSDDLDQSKYILYRTITLLSVYIYPFLVILIWVAEPLILFLYGEKWLAAAEPARIIAIGSLILPALRPCSVLLQAQNRLRQEIVVSVIALVVGAAGCFVGLRWGLVGVAWSVVLSQALSFALLYAFAYRTISTRLSELGQALAPALILSALLWISLAALHWFIAELAQRTPFAYLAAMGAVGGAVYGGAFLFLPMKTLEGEVARWRARLSAARRKAKFWSH